MINAIMLIALGFLIASLIGVLLAPSLWSRASRLSKKRLESTLPLTLSEIEATQDQLRASYAVRLRRLETALASAKQKAANQLVDNSRLQMQIAALKDQIGDLDLKLSERRNAATVLEQTITKRFPELDREISAVKAQLQERSYELQDLTNKLARRDEELAAAQGAAANYQDELARLRQVLEKSSADRSGRRVRRASQWDIEDYRSEYDRLNLELSKLRQQLAQFQDRDAQQVGVIKGELQKLAELILASAQPKGAPRQPDRSEPTTKRPSSQDARRERPMPWLQSPHAPMPLTARLKLNAEPTATEQAPDESEPAPLQSLSAPEALGVALSPVLTMLQDETVLTSAPKSGHGEAGARSKMLQGVVTDKPATEEWPAPPTIGASPGEKEAELPLPSGSTVVEDRSEPVSAAGLEEATPEPNAQGELENTWPRQASDEPILEETVAAEEEVFTPSDGGGAQDVASASDDEAAVEAAPEESAQPAVEAPFAPLASEEAVFGPLQDDTPQEEPAANPSEEEIPSEAQKRSEKAFADARELQSISELAVIAANGAYHAPRESEDDLEAMAKILDLEPIKPDPEPETAGTPAPTLIERLRGIADEPAKAED